MTTAQSPPSHDHISDYERAICYYTLPQVTNPLTFGLVVAYALVLVESIGALGIGLLIQHPTWIFAGTLATVATIVFGVIVFSLRALVNEVREKKLLAQAHGVPDVGEEADAEAGDIPDPFANHVLLRHPRTHPGQLFACTENDSTVDYLVEAAPNRSWWKVSTPDGTEVCRIKALPGGFSLTFVLTQPTPNILSVYKGDHEAARLTRRASLPSPYFEIALREPRPCEYRVLRRGIYAMPRGARRTQEGRLVGRMYYVRQSFYLDIEREHFNVGVLAYFAALT